MKPPAQFPHLISSSLINLTLPLPTQPQTERISIYAKFLLGDGNNSACRTEQSNAFHRKRPALPRNRVQPTGTVTAKRLQSQRQTIRPPPALPRDLTHAWPGKIKYLDASACAQTCPPDGSRLPCSPRPALPWCQRIYLAGDHGVVSLRESAGGREGGERKLACRADAGVIVVDPTVLSSLSRMTGRAPRCAASCCLPMHARVGSCSCGSD